MADPRKLYANVSFVIDLEENETIYFERQELAFKYFYHLNKSAKILNDAKALNALQYTHSNMNKWFKCIHQQIELSLKYDFSKIILNIIENCYQRIIECIHFINQENEVNKKNRIGSMAICLMAIEILDMFTNYSRKFSIKFHIDNYPISFKTIFNLINNRKIQQYCLNLNQIQPKSQEFVLMNGIFKSLLSSIVNLTRHANFECKKIWHEFNSIEIFEDYLNKMNGVLNVSTHISLVKAYLLDENLNEDVIKHLIYLFRLITYQNTRIELKIEPKQNKTHKIAYINRSGNIFNSIDLIRVFIKICSIDKSKTLVYFKFKLKKYLTRAIYNSSEFQLKYCLYLLWNLCYNLEIANDITKNELLMKFLLKLSKSSNYNKSIQFISTGIIYCLSNSEFNSSIKINKINGFNIMILNQSDNLNLCLSIKNELEKHDYKIYLDSNDHDDNHNFRSKLIQIEQSFCILICLNENFELNDINTGFRAECKHAIKLNKPIIPIIMQRNNIIEEFSNVSWLNEILSENIGFHVYKSCFDLCLNGLNEHILSVKDRLLNKKKVVFDWNEQTVEKWLVSKNLNKNLIDNILPCNGYILHELYLIILNAPNYFYQQLSSIQNNEFDNENNFSVNEFTLFKKYLKELFD